MGTLAHRALKVKKRQMAEQDPDALNYEPYREDSDDEVIEGVDEKGMTNYEHQLVGLFDRIIVDEAHKVKNKNTKIHKAIIKARANSHILITGTPMSNKLHDFEGMIRLFWRPKTGGLDEPFHPPLKASILSIEWLRFHVRPGSFHTIDATYIPCFEHLNMPDNLQSGDALVGVPAPAPVHEQGFVLFFSICHTVVRPDRLWFGTLSEQRVTREAGSFNAVKHEFDDDFELPRRDLNLRGSLFSVARLSPFTDGKREFVACRPSEVTFIGWLQHLLMDPGREFA
ncbi:hypothetical protein E4T50_14905 [Aureobasidium sp. EXF-12298]|nr:hypothetical protein E4T50_14905 [Aureobasidium sp. EXF-12298]KAI4753025.1 hypothetical protein E4T51_13833 [Aureobasidium sp. EXF-12344]KAI4770152.1 hypothetical protein E4T52_14814 [Aureobasidium sp. EXF-3400]